MIFMMLLILEMLLTDNDAKAVDNEVHDNFDEVVASKVFFLDDAVASTVYARL